MKPSLPIHSPVNLIHFRIAKVLSAIIVLFLISLATKAQSDSASKNKHSEGHARSFVNSEGLKQTLGNFKGKKVWIIILPDSLKTRDTSLLTKIDSVVISRNPLVQTIVIPSIGHNGRITDGGKAFEKFYKILRGHNVIFSSPAGLNKEKMSNQGNDLIFWLNDAALNGHFTKDLTGAGSMYLMDEQGILKGVFDINTLWNNQFLRIIFQ